MLFFLFLPLILYPAHAQSVPDYDNPYSPIFTDKPVYSWTDKMKITIIAPSWNTDKHLVDSIGGTDEHPIKIATSEYTLEPYRFTETDVNSGVFTAEVILTGFLHDVDGDGDFDTNPRTFGNGPTSGFLEVDRDSAISISFEFADGVVLVEPVLVSWNIGTINFTNDLFYLENPVTVRVVDFDMNLNPEILDNVLIQIFSDSDAAGIDVNAVETSESSGFFVAHISLSQDLPSSGNRLYSLPGDKIFAKYDDYTLPKPYSKSDDLTLETFARVDSSIPAIERIENHSIVLSDVSGNLLQSLPKNSQVQIIGEISNKHNFKQNFVYLFQIKDDENMIDSISLIQGEIPANRNLDFSKSWTPKKDGTYTIETFVWNSLNDTIVLSPIMSTLVTVS